MPGKKPRWDPTKEQIDQVRFLTGTGWSLERLAQLLGVSKPTFERAVKKNATLRDALQKGRYLADAHVTQSLFEMATTGKVPAAAIFWAKTRMRWSEPPREIIPMGGLLNENTSAIDQKKADEVVEQFKGLLAEFERIPRDEPTARVESHQPTGPDGGLLENEGGE